MASFAQTALRSFDNDLAPFVKGLSLPTVAPLILVAFVIFFLFKLFLGNTASQYSPLASRLALTAADIWNRRYELGLSPSIRGKTLASLEPLTEVLDALSRTVQKYESEPSPNTFRQPSSKVRFE